MISFAKENLVLSIFILAQLKAAFLLAETEEEVQQVKHTARARMEGFTPRIFQAYTMLANHIRGILLVLVNMEMVISVAINLFPATFFHLLFH